MSKFINELTVKVPLDGGDRELINPLEYHSDLINGLIIAPRGMKTDYGSIPKVLHNVLSPTGKPTYGFVIHDHLYQSGVFTRDESDAILYEAMELLDVGWFKRRTIITGLKVGGWVAWNNYRKKDKK